MVNKIKEAIKEASAYAIKETNQRIIKDNENDVKFLKEYRECKKGLKEAWTNNYVKVLIISFLLGTIQLIALTIISIGNYIINLF